MFTPDPIQLAKHYLTLDRDPTTRAEIQTLLDANNTTELLRRLHPRITFGTAGLRASMKAGFAHMNALTVLSASHGLAAYVRKVAAAEAGKEGSDGGVGELKVVIGYDARHNSARFAGLTAAAFLGHGFKVVWFGEEVHTPLVPFCVQRYEAKVGVMITASHNPKADNGYKVYWGNGCQIVPPLDVGIAEEIERVGGVRTWDHTLVERDENVDWVYDEALGEYRENVKSLVGDLRWWQTPLSFAYTPMHGVGLKIAMDIFEHVDIPLERIKVVAAQARPDPEFPTVPFPNPEEKGALDMAKEEGEATGVDMVLANDPDADRFSVAERVGPCNYQQLTGNQIGILFASHVFETYQGDKSRLVMLASTVSSRMLTRMAEVEGFQFRETLTGFKWLGNVAQQLLGQGLEPAFAYEEAIGYMFPSVVWDKDGVAAAAVFLKAWKRWHLKGLTPLQKLQQLYEKYGYFEDANTYIVSPSPAITTAAFDAIRKLNAGSRPSHIGHRKILRWRDLTIGYDSGTPDLVPVLPCDSSSQMITCELLDVVFTVRGSGTEPKIKFYVEARASSSEQATTLARDVVSDIRSEWFKSVIDSSC